MSHHTVVFSVCVGMSLWAGSHGRAGTIAYFPFDSDYKSIVNVACNPDSAVTFSQAGGSLKFETADKVGKYIRVDDTVRADEGYLVAEQSRVYVDLSRFATGEEMDSATVEFFFRSDSTVNWGCKFALMRAKAESIYDNSRPYLVDLQRTSAGAIRMRADAVNHNGTDSVGENYVYCDAAGGFDGEWHHLAMTFTPVLGEGDVQMGSKVSFYFDHNLLGTKDLANPWRGFAENENGRLYLTVGEASSKVAVDEVRISDCVLAKSDFLSFRNADPPKNGDALVYLMFEGNLDSQAKCDDVDQPVLDVAPPFAYSTDVIRDVITTYDRTEKINEQNKFSWGLSGIARFKLPYWALWSNSLDSATVECFVKGTDKAANWMTLVKVGHSSDPILFLVQLNSATPRQFSLRADGWTSLTEFEKVEYTVPAAKGNYEDGKWHHVAMTAEPCGDGRSTIRFYFDYECVCEKNTASYAWRGIDPESMYLFFGRNECEQLVDEFRITKGALSVDKMLRKGPAGVVLVVR